VEKRPNVERTDRERTSRRTRIRLEIARDKKKSQQKWMINTAEAAARKSGKERDR
jgi:hypothetical protein